MAATMPMSSLTFVSGSSNAKNRSPPSSTRSGEPVPVWTPNVLRDFRSSASSSSITGYWIRMTATRPSSDTAGALVLTTLGSALTPARTSARAARAAGESENVAWSSRGVTTSWAVSPASSDPAAVSSSVARSESTPGATNESSSSRPKAPDAPITTTDTTSHEPITVHGRRAEKRPNRYRRCDITGLLRRIRRRSVTGVGGVHHRAEGSNSPGRNGDVRLVLAADTAVSRVLYAGHLMRTAAASLWAEPRAPAPPARVWRDWVLVAVLVPTAVLEGLLREDVAWPAVAVVLALIAVSTLLWRRTRPLLAVAVAFGAFSAGAVAAILWADEPVGLYTGLCVLLLPYALFRWGAGREAAIGLAIILATCVVGIAADRTGALEAVFGTVFLLFPAALGASVRYRVSSRLREIDQVKLLEREQLARELHDTVAHHVSAIAIQAQAGRTVAPADPDAAVRILEVIEEAASRTLAEMRTMVGVLRDGEEPELAPQRGVADIERLARDAAHGPRVEVELSGDLDALRPSVGAAMYRLAQESITNASQHARNATRIHVFVAGEDDCVRLTVRDDGDAGAAERSPSGYGLVGMTERATLLGGTLEAGPGLEKGWTVNAVLPRAGTGT